MSDRLIWERAANGALMNGAGYRHFRGNMLERFRELFPIEEMTFDMGNEARCLAFLFMAALEDATRNQKRRKTR